MKAALKNGKMAVTALFFLFSLLAHAATGFVAQPANEDCECPAPVVTKTSQTLTSVAFSWGNVSGATAYRIWYVRKGDNFTSQEINTGATSVSFSNLSAGTYQFYFAVNCGEEVSQIIITDDLIMG
jgi:hypothetical protein